MTGRIIDGGGAVLKDGLAEIWQTDAERLYNSPSETCRESDPNFTGWGRKATDMETGLFVFETIKPGPTPFPDGCTQVPHINFWIVAHGINLGLNTRMYFVDEEKSNAVDPTLARIEPKDRLKTLLAKRDGNTHTFDVHLQGENETVFFDI